MFYKCHNCGAGTTLYGLIKHVDPSMANQYNIENYKEGKSTKPVEKAAIKTDFKPNFRQHNIVSKILTPLLQLEDNNPAILYMKRRRIPPSKLKDLFYIDNVQRLEQLDDRYKDRIVGEEPRIVLPFYDRSGIMVAIQGRAIDSNPFRYLTLKLDEDKPLIYGLDQVDLNKTVYVTEGPFDSMFLPNAVAVGGADLKRATRELNGADVVMVFDNQPRNKEVIKIMETQLDKKIVIWPDHIKEKDINDMVVSGCSEAKILNLINVSTYSGLALRAALNNWKKC
jgi:hypothetical protein